MMQRAIWLSNFLIGNVTNKYRLIITREIKTTDDSLHIVFVADLASTFFAYAHIHIPSRVF